MGLPYLLFSHSFLSSSSVLVFPFSFLTHIANSRQVWHRTWERNLVMVPGIFIHFYLWQREEGRGVHWENKKMQTYECKKFKYILLSVTHLLMVKVMMLVIPVWDWFLRWHEESNSGRVSFFKVGPPSVSQLAENRNMNVLSEHHFGDWIYFPPSYYWFWATKWNLAN